MFNLIPKKKNETDIVETINKIFQEVEIKLDDSIYSNESKNNMHENYDGKIENKEISIFSKIFCCF